MTVGELEAELAKIEDKSKIVDITMRDYDGDEMIGNLEEVKVTSTNVELRG